MKKITVFLLAVLALGSCAPSQKLPAAPDIGTYYNAEWVKLDQERKVNKEAKRVKTGTSKKRSAFIGGSMFVVYCIFAWRSDRE